jgi:hypothetical protein
MTAVAPPNMPTGLDPRLDPKLVDYLRRFSFWAYNELNAKISINEAVPQLMLSASDEKPPVHVFVVTVDSSGAMSIHPVPLGGGKP